MGVAGSCRWLWLALGIVVADRATKYAVERLAPVGFRRELVPHFAWLVHSFNPGIAFGMFSGSGSKAISTMLAAAAAVVVAFLIWLLASGRAGGTVTQAGLALIAGGAAGNLLDRVLHGGVTDFLELRAGPLEWPAFNLADSAITIGALLLIYELLRGERQTTRRRP